MKVRQERPEDAAALRALHEGAFPTDAEARLVEWLRADGDAEISMVVEDENEDGGEVISHALLSRMAAPMRALALAPVATAEAHRRKGAAAMAIRAGIEAARGTWDAIFVLGDPAYYSRFGFVTADAVGYETPYACEAFAALILTPGTARAGRLTHAAAFARLEET